MPRLELRFGDLVMRVAKFLQDSPTPSGWEGSDPSDTNYQICKELVLDGYSTFLHERPEGWAFLDSYATMTAWPTATGTVSGTPTSVTTTTGTTTAAAPAYDWPHSTIIATTAIFNEDMVGDALAIAGTVGGTYYIDEYISTTQVKVAGDASGEGTSKTITITHRVAYSVVTATSAKFYASMVGRGFTFDTSETDYTIYKYQSATVIWVVGDASGETADDTFTITATGDYRLPDDFGSILSSFNYPTNRAYRSPAERPAAFIRERRALEAGVAGYPAYFAIQAKPSTPSYRQFWDVMFQPTPAESLTFGYEYKINPVQPENFTDVFLGGPEHNMTILQATLMIAEQHRGDTDGPQAQIYRNVHLPRSIRIDNDKRPRNLGPVKGRRDYELEGTTRRVEVIHTLS